MKFKLNYRVQPSISFLHVANDNRKLTLVRPSQIIIMIE